MHFALLVPRLPHVDDVRTPYADMLVPASRPHRVHQRARIAWSWLSKLIS
jgi:hypothetical protein